MSTLIQILSLIWGIIRAVTTTVKTEINNIQIEIEAHKEDLDSILETVSDKLNAFDMKTDDGINGIVAKIESIKKAVNTENIVTVVKITLMTTTIVALAAGLVLTFGIQSIIIATILGILIGLWAVYAITQMMD